MLAIRPVVVVLVELGQPDNVSTAETATFVHTALKLSLECPLSRVRLVAVKARTLDELACNTCLNPTQIRRGESARTLLTRSVGVSEGLQWNADVLT